MNSDRPETPELEGHEYPTRSDFSSNLLGLILNELPDGIAVIDSGGEIQLVNEAWRCFAWNNGGELHQLCEGANYLDVCDAAARTGADRASDIGTALRNVLAGVEVRTSFEYPCHAPGQQRWFVLNICRIMEGQAVYALVRHHNITELKLRERKLAEAHLLLREAVNAAGVGVWSWDIETGRVSLSPEWKVHLGYTDKEPLETFEAWANLFHPDEAAQVRENLNDLAEGRAHNVRLQVRMRHKNGDYRHVLTRVALFSADAGTPARALGCHVDLTEELSNKERLERLAAQLRELALELTMAESTQLKNVSRILHEYVVQDLASARLQLNRLSGSDEAQRPSITRTSSIIDKVTRELRDLSTELSPPSLTQLGLAAALESLVTTCQAKHEIDCTCETHGVPKRKDERLDLIVYHAARELVKNVVTHASATRLQLALYYDDTSIELRVVDDGIGMAPTLVEDRSNSARGYGLFSLLQRCTHLNGKLDIKPNAPSGTTVRVMFPV